jgi:SAM-dependent methyltransferase
MGGVLVTGLKRTLRRLLHPGLARPVQFNAAAVRRLEALQTDLAKLQAEQESLRRAESELFSELVIQQELARQIEPRLEALEHRSHTPEQIELPLERFRGSESVIRERQRVYVPLFAGQSEVVDLGCGRGEFLDLLREAGIPASGVEYDAELVARCRAEGLDVVQDDALSFLARSQPESLGGIFAAQLIEHLAVGDVARLLALASTRLRPGAAIVLETVNPLNFTSLADFWLDPTHQRPLHPELMRWLAERQGFVDVRITTSIRDADRAVPPLRLAADQALNLEEFNAGITRINDALFGDFAYALVAQRAA